MRHGDKVNNLGRTTAHRKALMSNLACNLIEHKRIITTLAKAKSLRGYVEPLITRCKSDSTHNRRIVFSYLQNKEAIKELFGVISDKVSNRPGGYTRIIKLQPRFGDAAEMALIELVDFNELYKKGGDESKKKTRRSRRGGGRKVESTQYVSNSLGFNTSTVSEQDNAALETSDAIELPAIEENTATVETKNETTPTAEKSTDDAESAVVETPVADAPAESVASTTPTEPTPDPNQAPSEASEEPAAS